MTARILIDNSLEPGASCFLFENPRGEIRADTPGEVDGALAALSRALAGGAWAAGFFAYELGYLMEPRLRPLLPEKRSVPLLRFALFDAPDELTPERTQAVLEAWTQGGYALAPPGLSMDRAVYRERFARAKAYIGAGDIYQINLTLKARFGLEGCPVALYRDLRRKQPVAHGALMRFDDLTVLSHSPELFLGIRDGTAFSRPMKGTAARAATPEQDRERREWLARDEKSRAENLMILDLMRNDLGRVAETGGVQVTDLFSVESYRTLHQMTSGVSARLRDPGDFVAVLKSLFPPGSITGAPKVRAMEIIRELESEPRGVYTGAVGMLAPGGEARLNVAIRTLVLDAAGRGEIGIGSGVVNDSRAEAEYDECVLKMRFLTDPARDFELIETLLYEAGGGYALLGRHLDRLAASAAYFGYPFDREAARRALEAEARGCREGALRVRLLLAADGALSLSSTPLAAPAQQTTRYVISERPADSGDVFLYHKTTLRDLYEAEHARAAELGADEVVFVNERGELTEGTRTNLFLRRGGALLTPPVDSGLLPGTLRAELLARGQAREAVLTPEDLEDAEAVFLGNSVRGLAPAAALSAPVRGAAQG